MTQDAQRGDRGAAAGNILRGLKKANRTSVIAEIVSTDGEIPSKQNPLIQEPPAAAAEPEEKEPEVAQPPQVAPPAPLAPSPAYVQPAPIYQTFAAPQSQAPAPPTPAEDLTKKKKTGIFQTPEQYTRLRATFDATRHLTGYQTMSEYAAAAIDALNDHMEQTYNGGEPFTVRPGAVRAGRPIKLD